MGAKTAWRLALSAVAFAVAALHGGEVAAQTLVASDDGSNTMRILFQTLIWSAPNIHYSDGDGWTAVPGFPMVNSTYDGFPASEGWFEYNLTSKTLEFVFNDGNGVWDNNNEQNYYVATPGTWSVVSKVTVQPEPVAEQPYLTTPGYVVTKVDENSSRLKLTLTRNTSVTNTTYGEDDVDQLTVEVITSGSTGVRVKIADAAAKRWQVPSTLYAKGELGSTAQSAKWSSGVRQKSLVSFTYTKDPFTFQVTRKSDGYVLFDSSALSLVIKDKYLQVATKVASDLSVYGFGETTHSNMRLNLGDKHTLWARDQGSATPNVNLYGSHPFFLGLNTKGKAHGVFLLNSNGMDMTFEDGYVAYQAIGGILDFHIFAGPSPGEVVSQYTSIIGRPVLQPYWAYGFHQCRWGYNSTAALREVVDQYKANSLPLDVMWADIDYMNGYHDFTLDPVNFVQADLASLLNDVHAAGQHFVPIIDPGIPDSQEDEAYTRGLELDVFIKSTDGIPYLGQVWPGPTVFPDFFHPKAQSYWNEQLKRMRGMLDFDGIWIDMNEIANFCHGLTCARQDNVTCPYTGSISKITTCCLSCVDDLNEYNHPPFQINNVGARTDLFYKTVSTSALQYGNLRQYDTHNLYGFTEAIATHTALENLLKKRAFVLSRSTFPGSGGYTAHWTGDNAATWNDIQWSIPTILNFGLYGIPMVGADICGFSSTTTEELCARWTALGSFYPFSRNHNNLEAEPQETYRWASVAEVGRKFIGMRYRLLPYLYTLGYTAHSTGLPIARALFIEFPEDTNVHGSPILDNQFMLGDALLVTPVLTEGATSISGYLPAGVWYDLFNNYTKVEGGASHTWDVSLYDMPVHVRGGRVVPMHQAGALTSAAARKTPYDLVVALASDGSASGSLYQDDIDAINGDDKSRITQFTVTSSSGKSSGGVLRNKVAQNHYNGNAFTDSVSKVVVLGVAKKPSQVSVGNGSGKAPTFTFDATNGVLTIDVSKSGVKLTKDFTVTWK